MEKTTLLEPPRISHAKSLNVCFSFAAYAKNLILHLQDSNVPVEIGLSEREFFDLESSLDFEFPPDLRAVLQEGLPVGPGFPNWRSSSRQQLEILINLPVLGICKEVSRNGFWLEEWGERPKYDDRAVKLAGGILRRVPVLVPIYRNFYISTEPGLAGNPVFYVDGGDVSVWSFDISGFFQRVEFDISKLRIGPGDVFAPPAWAAKEARVIEFWTEFTTRSTNRVASCGNVAPGGKWWSGVLASCLEEVQLKLRDGGWKEDDVKEMMMMGRGDEVVHDTCIYQSPPDKECVRKRVRVLSIKLLRAGWSMKDVVESFGLNEDCHFDGVSFFDAYCKPSNEPIKPTSLRSRESCFDACRKPSNEQIKPTPTTLRSLVGL